ncbi:MAG: alanine--tRNA ligase-related protein [Candidatus Marsarchaeota archaeon]|nr:alanine--tRNA ligase-related protein [Candidatus Marsarchaeota archaeon]
MSNSVFTQYEYINNKIKELDGMVVDVGWGFERLLWFYTGADTIYDASFNKQLKYIAKNSGIKFDRKIYRKVADISGFVNVGDAQSLEKFDDYIINRAKITKDDYYNIIKPMQAAYAIADHSRSLLFGVTDGALPSNVGGGYNLRIILRRMFDLVDEHNINLDIIKLMELHASELKGLYDELSDGVAEMPNIIEVERKRYDATKSAAGKIVDTMLAKKESITTDRLKLLYESNGITPEHIAIVAKSKGINVEIPENFYSSIIKSDFVEGKKVKVSKSQLDTSTLPKTEKLFYSFTSKAQARAIKVEGNEVVLDKTPFYAESGGQEADFGMINGINVIDVQSSNGVIVHTLEHKPNFLVNNIVNCEVDIDRRLRLMVHHTATHLISASCRKVLGKHAWQEGAHKGPDKAHIDIAHHE